MEVFFNRIRYCDINEANDILHTQCGIVDFFESEDDRRSFITDFDNYQSIVSESRILYGDWQTPLSLAKSVCRQHKSLFGSPDVVIEPTCGTGSFVLASLELYEEVKEIYAIEINPSYVRQLKGDILRQSFFNKRKRWPEIHIFTNDFYEFDFSNLIKSAVANNSCIALIGNPPWVTNSRQGKLEASNLPTKNNRFGLKGIEAITGKSNFDISEYITLSVIGLFQHCRGGVSMLLKNSVARNIITRQRTLAQHIGDIRQSNIDAAKEFDVAVEAACLSARLSSSPSTTCSVYDFYTGNFITEYGWVRDRFVSDVDAYEASAVFDGSSPLEWRSGVKHDCSKVLELTYVSGRGYVNGLNETVNIENTLVYPLLKSSDANNYDERKSNNRYLIIPQRSIGESTMSLKLLCPLTYAYLESHIAFFERRKSSVYKGKDRFAVFGIGDYTFKPYKVIVSSLYRKFKFCLVGLAEDKPTVVDDTCYQLGFDSEEEARTILDILQSKEIMAFLKTIVFPDAKRVVTKDILMRIDLYRAYERLGKGRYCPSLRNNQYSLFDSL